MQECRVEFHAARTNSSVLLRSGLRESESARSVRDGDSREFLTSSRCRSEESKADQEWQEKKAATVSKLKRTSDHLSDHQSDMSSDDLFGEDEIESVRPGHVEALGAAFFELGVRRWGDWRRSFRYQTRPYALSKNRHCTHG